MAFALGLLVWAVHFGEAYFDDRPAAFYVLRGLEGAALFGLVGWLLRANTLVLAVCLWGMLEEAQTAACGWAESAEGNPVGMCMTLVGPWPYAAAGAACIVYLIRGKK